MAEDNKDMGSAAPAGGTSKVVVIASIVNLLATVAIVALLILNHSKEKNKETVADIVKGSEASGDAHDSGKPAEHGGDHGAAKKDDGHGGSGDHGAAKGAHGAADSDVGKVIHLEPFAVNLSTAMGSSPRYVRMNVSVELEKGADEKEFENKVPRVRDTVINLLNSKKPSDLNSAEGREQLKEDIKNSVNSFLLQSKVKGVYFTNFVIAQ